MIQAKIRSTDLLRRKVELWIVRDEGYESYSTLGSDGTWTRHVAVEAYEEPTQATLTLPTDALPALLAELSKHLGAVEHPMQLRSDYEFERKRADKLTDALLGVVERTTG